MHEGAPQGPLTKAAAQGLLSGQALLHEPPFGELCPSLLLPQVSTHSLAPDTDSGKGQQSSLNLATPSPPRADITDQPNTGLGRQHRTADPDPSNSRARPQAGPLMALALRN